MPPEFQVLKEGYFYGNHAKAPKPLKNKTGPGPQKPTTVHTAKQASSLPEGLPDSP